MIRLAAIALLGLLPAVARANWSNLKVGMDRARVAACVGQPLLQNHGRGGAEIWTYDRCGYIEFSRGQVVYWAPSKPEPHRQRAQLPVLVQKPKSVRPSAEVVAVRD